MEKKRLITTTAAVTILGALAIGGTLAYLTDTDTKTNNFTITDKVEIEVIETNWVPDVTEIVTETDDSGQTVTDPVSSEPVTEVIDSKKVIPSQVVAKDPVVKNNAAEDVIVFIKLTSPKATMDGTPGELFYYGTSDAKMSGNRFNSDWINISDSLSSQGDNNAAYYLFGYKTKLAKDNSTDALFTHVQLKNYGSSDTNPTFESILVEAYAIQADNLYDTSDALITTDGDLTADTLKKIYTAYVDDTTSQNADPVEPPAGD